MGRKDPYHRPSGMEQDWCLQGSGPRGAGQQLCLRDLPPEAAGTQWRLEGDTSTADDGHAQRMIALKHGNTGFKYMSRIFYG